MSGRGKNSVTLGSGLLYVAEFTGDIPSYAEMETADNLIGYIQGGYTLEYGAEWYTAKDDLGYVQKSILTDETVTAKSGVMTFNAKSLQKLSSTARVTEKDGVRTLKIGGVGNQDGKKYVIHFHHMDKDEGDIRVDIVGKNQAGFTLAFTKDKETVVDAEFNAMPMDDEGTLVTYTEYEPAGTAALYTLTVEAGAGGSVTTGTSGTYAAGAVIPIVAEPDGGNAFSGWANTNGGTFADATAAATTFTMPHGDTTITASFA